MHRRLFVILLAAGMLLAGCGAKETSTTESSKEVTTEVSSSVEATTTESVAEVSDSTEEVQKKEATVTETTAKKDIEYSTIYDTVKGWGEGRVKSLRTERVVDLLNSQGNYLPAEGERMMLVSNCNNYVKIHDSESDYQDTILIKNEEGVYNVNQLSTTSITDSGNNSAQTTVHYQLIYAPSETGKDYNRSGYSKVIIPSEGLVGEETPGSTTTDGILPSYTRIIRDFVNHIDDDYIFDAEYIASESGDTVSITVFQNINGSDWGLVGGQYALTATINIGSSDKLQRMTFSITSATNESYEYHGDNEYQVQCTIQYNYNEEGISETLTADLKAEKEKADKKNSKNTTKKK